MHFYGEKVVPKVEVIQILMKKDIKKVILIIIIKKGKDLNNSISNNQRENYEDYKPYSNDLNKDIEIDTSKIKYPLLIKYKYSLKDIQNIFEKIKISNENPFYGKNKEICSELIREEPKTMVSLDKMMKDNIKEIKEEKKEGEINTNIKIPKINPLSNIGKGNFEEKNEKKKII